MKTHFLFKKTNQLSENEKLQICKLLSDVSTTQLTVLRFDQKYLQTPLGYSYHGLMISADSIVGMFNAIPSLYNFFDERVMFCLAADVAVDTEYRCHPFSLLKMETLTVDAMQQDDIGFMFGFPNDNICGYLLKLLRWRVIGELDVYLLPRNLGSIFPKLKLLNIASSAFASALVQLPSWGKHDTCNFNIEKTKGVNYKAPTYDSSWQAIKLYDGCEVICKLVVKGKTRLLDLIDVCPLTPYTFDHAINHVFYYEGKDADLIRFIGKLPFRPTKLIRVGSVLRRHTSHFCGKILDHKAIDDRVFDINNWNVNLSNSDVP